MDFLYFDVRGDTRDPDIAMKNMVIYVPFFDAIGPMLGGFGLGYGRGFILCLNFGGDITDNGENDEVFGHEKRPFRAGSSMVRRVAKADGSRRPSAVASIAARA